MHTGTKGKKLKILLLEDMENEAEMILWTLKKSNMDFTSARVEKRDEFITALDNFQPDVILSDHSLPQFNSTEAFNICKSREPDIPFILVTGRVSEEFAVESLKRGMDNYILKSNLTRLPTAIGQALREKYLEARKKEAEIAISNQNTELIKINKELDSFAYSVSHNLKSPLTSIQGLINLMRIEGVTDREKLFNMLSLMEGCVDRLNSTLSEILDHSRNSRTEVIPVKIDLKNMVESCFNDLKPIEGYDEVELKVQVIEEYPFYSDRFRLTTIFCNFLSNSIKYRDKNKSGSYIHVACRVGLNKAEITINDNGIGIPDDQIPKIFEMFTRCSEISDGSGLGLYIVREMVDTLNGNLLVSSQVDIGTSITISIPNSYEFAEKYKEQALSYISLAALLFPILSGMESLVLAGTV